MWSCELPEFQTFSSHPQLAQIPFLVSSSLMARNQTPNYKLKRFKKSIKV
jgi:hypothetical protein